MSLLHHQLAGTWLQVSYFVLSLVCIPVIALWAVTEPILRLMGKDKLAVDAAYYSLVLIGSIPVRVAFSQLSQFFISQRIMKPQVCLRVNPRGGVVVPNFILLAHTHWLGLMVPMPRSPWPSLLWCGILFLASFLF